MSEQDDDHNGNKNQNKPQGSILDQVKATLTKEAREALKGKLKGKLVKRHEHERAIAQLDVEITAEIEAFEKGL